MDDLSADEFFFCVLAALSSGYWLLFVLGPASLHPRSQLSLLARGLLLVTALASCGGTYCVIQSFADDQVRHHGQYVMAFMLGQGLLFALTCWGMSIVGIGVAPDLVERGNSAAAVVIAAALIATSLIYAGSNIGAGPTIWTTIAPACLGTIALGFVWILIDACGGAVLDDIAIDRDVASGLRVGGAFIGCGIILGRAAAGRWMGWDDMFTSMLHRGWPALPLAICAAILHRIFRPTPQNPRPSLLAAGWVPMAFFIAMGVLVYFLEAQPLHPLQW